MRLSRATEYVCDLTEKHGCSFTFARTAEVAATVMATCVRLSDGIDPETVLQSSLALGRSLKAWSGVSDEDGLDAAPTMENWELFMTAAPHICIEIIDRLSDEIVTDGPDPTA